MIYNKIAHTLVDGSVAITTLVVPLEESAIMEHIQHLHNLNPGKYVSSRPIEESQLPTSRAFRNAWTDPGQGTDSIAVNLEKAKEIKKDQLRVDRLPFLQSLDVLYIRADEDSNKQVKTEIAEKKQLLRNVTNLTLPDDLKELEDFRPDCFE